jgi:hypothetical protein
MDSAASDDFYASLPVFADFTLVTDEARFAPLPDGWIVGVADIVGSTKAIAENRYKAVNVAGAAVIVAITNALAGRDFPFVFGGDGASFAVSGADAAAARQALAETATWVGEDLDLTLRIGMVPVRDIRAQGHDVRVARYAPSPNISIAMFSGGGLAWADAAMKRGEIAVPAAAPGAHPDLSGLSCRYELIPSQRGQVLSLVVTPGPRATPASFRAAVQAITDIVEQTPDASRPLPGTGLKFKWPPAGVDLEARAARKAGESIRVPKLKLLAFTFLGFLVLRFRLRVGRFSLDKYERELIDNSRLPQVRRFAAHGARLHAGAGGRDRGLSEGGASRRRGALRHAQAERGDDDLLCAQSGQSQPRAFHRRRGRGLCDGGDGDEGLAVVIAGLDPAIHAAMPRRNTYDLSV